MVGGIDIKMVHGLLVGHCSNGVREKTGSTLMNTDTWLLAGNILSGVKVGLGSILIRLMVI